MSCSPTTSRSAALPQSGTAALELPADLVSMLQKEAKVRRKTIAKVVREWLEDQADARDATRVMKRIVVLLPYLTVDPQNAAFAGAG